MLAEDRLANLLIIREKLVLLGDRHGTPGRQLKQDAIRAIDQRIDDACRTMAETLKREGVDGVRPEVVYILFDSQGSRTFTKVESLLKRVPSQGAEGQAYFSYAGFKAAITASEFRPGCAASVTLGGQAYHVFAAQSSWLPGAT